MRLVPPWHRCSSPPAHACPTLDDLLPVYATSEDRLARINRLRNGLSRSWEGALILGEGNHLNRVYAPMVGGAIEIVELAEKLLSDPRPERRRRLRRAIDEYLRDVDTAQRLEQIEDVTEEATR